MSPEGARLTDRQRQVLEFIDTEVRRRGYPPSVREIGEAVGLSSSSTVHAHLGALQDKGYLRRLSTTPIGAVRLLAAQVILNFGLAATAVLSTCSGDRIVSCAKGAPRAEGTGHHRRYP